MGSGGYATAIPKWEKMEADILTKGSTPESLNWPKRAKNWFFAHGGRLHLETGKLVHGSKLERATQRFSYALQAKAIDAFRPNRENDCRCFGPTGPQPTSESVLRVPNLGW